MQMLGSAGISVAQINKIAPFTRAVGQLKFFDLSGGRHNDLRHDLGLALKPILERSGDFYGIAGASDFHLYNVG